MTDCVPAAARVLPAITASDVIPAVLMLLGGLVVIAAVIVPFVYWVLGDPEGSEERPFPEPPDLRVP